MKKILGIANNLSKALQRKKQDIVNAMTLIQVSKKALQGLRDNGYDTIMNEVFRFCSEHKIDVPSMEYKLAPLGRSSLLLWYVLPCH